MLFFLGMLIGFVIALPIGGIGAFWLHKQRRMARLYDEEKDSIDRGE